MLKTCFFSQHHCDPLSHFQWRRVYLFALDLQQKRDNLRSQKLGQAPKPTKDFLDLQRRARYFARKPDHAIHKVLRTYGGQFVNIREAMRYHNARLAAEKKM